MIINDLCEFLEVFNWNPIKPFHKFIKGKFPIVIHV